MNIDNSFKNEVKEYAVVPILLKKDIWSPEVNQAGVDLIATEEKLVEWAHLTILERTKKVKQLHP